MMFLCFALFPIFLVCVFLFQQWIQKRAKNLLPELHTPLSDGKHPTIVGFFHPYCNAGGGGERVLWTAIRALQNRYSHVKCVIYTGDIETSHEEILIKANQRFNITLPRTGPKDLQFIFLKRRWMVEASPYPVFTLLGQSLGSIVLGFEALMKFIPDIYIDTMGYAFTLPLFRYLGGCKVACYVHYPTISTDMLQTVASRTVSYNNAAIISRSKVLSYMKLLYYKLFAFIYGLAGRCSSVIIVNSTWTYGHILTIWNAPVKTHIVYPPCNVTEFLKIPLECDKNKNQHSIISIGQFRPEKGHPLQIKSFAKFMCNVPDHNKKNYKLVLVGGCRNEQDEKMVEMLKKLCQELGIEEYVQFKLNVSFTELKQCLQEATIGLHTMWNEHFGIGIVECMAGGTVILAHNSGGPKLDIVKDYDGKKTGFLADDVESYAQKMKEILDLSPEERLTIKYNSRDSVARFSEEEFEAGFLSVTESLFV